MSEAKAPTTFLATHQVITRGFPPGFALRESDAEREAQRRYEKSGVVSELRMCNPKSQDSGYQFYKNWPDRLL